MKKKLFATDFAVLVLAGVLAAQADAGALLKRPRC